jgi:hydroxymethylbilane synthase
LEDPAYRAVIATSSNRRRAQWLHRYPNHEITNIRGNVNTRLEKVASRGWDGAIFAAAGLLRINLGHHISQYLDWMVPAPAQGAMAVAILKGKPELEKIIGRLNHDETALCTMVERDFLHDMEAGCSAPVGAYAYIENGNLKFKAIALTIDGRETFEYEDDVTVGKAGEVGHRAAEVLLKQGAAKVIAELKSQ